MLYKIMPYSLSKILWGDRKSFGTKLIPNDPDYLKWKDAYHTFYNDTQKGSLGHVINHMGFKIISEIDMKGKKVLEIGPGVIDHNQYWNALPDSYSLTDIDLLFMEKSSTKLRSLGVNLEDLKVTDGKTLPFKDESFDIIVSFHQLEHVYELTLFLKEVHRILKPEGSFVGAVPAEGGLMWGLGRALTSRRYVAKNFDFDYDKIICWEHPNYVDRIKLEMNKLFLTTISVKKPLAFMPFDLSLSYSFISKKIKDEK